MLFFVIRFRFQAKLKSDQYYINFKDPPGGANCATCGGQCGFSVTKYWCPACYLWKDGRQIKVTIEMAANNQIPDHDVIEHAVSLPGFCSQRRGMIMHELLHVLGKYYRRLTSKNWTYIILALKLIITFWHPLTFIVLNNRRIRT